MRVAARCRWALPLAMVVALSCRDEPLPTPWQVANQSDPDAVRAAVLLRLHAQVLHVAPETRVVCVSVEGREPSAHLLMSLSGRNLHLQKEGHCSVRDTRFVEPISGARAAHVFVSAVELSEPGIASAQGGYQYGPLAGRGMAFKLAFQLGRWEITEEQATWIS